MDLKDLVESAEDVPFVYVVSADLVMIRERTRDKKKQYAFVFKVQWSDSSSTVVWRSYSEFFELQCLLLDSFPVEAGNKNESRIIPHLPGREIFKKSDIQLAEKRKPRISQYVNELLLLPAHISQGSLVVSFFHKRKEDPESFNQFPSHLNTKLEFDQGLQMDSDGVRDNVDEYLSIDNILNGQINASFDKSLSLGRQSQSNR